MKSKTEQKPASASGQRPAQSGAQNSKSSAPANGSGQSSKPSGNASAPAAGKKSFTPVAPQRKNPHGIPDYRLEVPNYHTTEEWTDGKLHYTVKGDFSAPAPSLCESKYLDKTKS